MGLGCVWKGGRGGWGVVGMGFEQGSVQSSDWLFLEFQLELHFPDVTVCVSATGQT